MMKLKWLHHPAYGRLYYYDSELNTKNRKMFLLKRFALASCSAKYGYDRKENRRYRKEFIKKTSEQFEVHHEPDGRIYAIPKEIHRKIQHIGMVAINKDSH